MTAIMILNYASAVKLTPIALIGLRIAFSIYAGWTMAATVVSSLFLWKSCGFFDVKDEKDVYRDEEKETKFCVVILYMVECLYIGLSLWLRNPLFAAIFLWALAGIRGR